MNMNGSLCVSVIMKVVSDKPSRWMSDGRNKEALMFLSLSR